MQSTNSPGYPGTQKKKNKTYDPVINEKTEEEKRKQKERNRMW